MLMNGLKVNSVVLYHYPYPLPFTPGNQKLRGEKVTYFFDNLLPDSRDIRERLARKFDFILVIGGSKNYYHVLEIQRRHFIHQALAVGFSEKESNDMIEKIFQGMISQAKKITI